MKKVENSKSNSAEKGKKKKGIPTVFLVLGFIAGLIAVSYPFVANAWNSQRDKQLIQSYTEEVSSGRDYSPEWEFARRYNEELLPGNLKDFLHSEEKNDADERYFEALNIRGDGVMGYISIPRIDIKLPIYHTTGDDVLEKGAGHVIGTALPTGGMGTHCVIAAHRGLPDNAMFTDLDRLTEGDQFYVYILDDVLAYQIDQILTVKPHETDALQAMPGSDLFTLVTCTPYGVNTHRLLVRGHRVTYQPEVEAAQKSIVKKSIYTSYGLLAFGAVAAALVSVLIVYYSVIIPAKRRKRRLEEYEKLKALYGGAYIKGRTSSRNTAYRNVGGSARPIYQPYANRYAGNNAGGKVLAYYPPRSAPVVPRVPYGYVPVEGAGRGNGQYPVRFN